MRTAAGRAVVIIPLIMQYYNIAFLERFARPCNRSRIQERAFAGERVAFQPRAGQAGSEDVAHAAEEAAPLARIEHRRADPARVGDGRDVADVVAGWLGGGRGGEGRAGAP